MVRRWMLLFVVILLLFVAVVTKDAVNVYEQVQSTDVHAYKETIIVDAGHGGSDPGKIAIDGTLEKDINLAIAMCLKQELISRGYAVVMTRESDRVTVSGNQSKMADMKERVAIANQSGGAMMVSIHQNSFTDASACGPQVFYYESSDEAGALAEVLQQSLNEMLQVAHPRTCKADTSYYMLRKTEPLSVIVECGFLSNETEAAKLSQRAYRETIACAIADAIEQYEAGMKHKRGTIQHGNKMD